MTDIPDLSGKVAIVTGPTATKLIHMSRHDQCGARDETQQNTRKVNGIGFESTVEMSRKGAQAEPSLVLAGFLVGKRALQCSGSSFAGHSCRTK